MAPDIAVALLGEAGELAAALRGRGAEPREVSWLPLVRRVDVAHAVEIGPWVGSPRLLPGGRPPLVLTWQGLPPMRPRLDRRWRLRQARRAVGEVDAVVAQTGAAADGLARWLGVDARVIGPPVDLATFRAAPRDRAVAPTILHAADPGARAALLLDAFARVRADVPEARLVVGGPQSAPAQPGVEWRTLDAAEVRAAADREAWVATQLGPVGTPGRALVEALASGTPAVGPHAELLDDPGVGRVVSGEDPGELAVALLAAFELARHPATPVACRVRAAEFTPDRWADAHLALYGELLDRR